MLKAEIYLSILAENEEKFLAEIAVAPLVGAWIEIGVCMVGLAVLRSLPSWERGLKSGWEPESDKRKSRSPRGSVD